MGHENSVALGLKVESGLSKHFKLIEATKTPKLVFRWSLLRFCKTGISSTKKYIRPFVLKMLIIAEKVVKNIMNERMFNK